MCIAVYRNAQKAPLGIERGGGILAIDNADVRVAFAWKGYVAGFVTKEALLRRTRRGVGCLGGGMDEWLGHPSGMDVQAKQPRCVR